MHRTDRTHSWLLPSLLTALLAVPLGCNGGDGNSEGTDSTTNSTTNPTTNATTGMTASGSNTVSASEGPTSASEATGSSGVSATNPTEPTDSTGTTGDPTGMTEGTGETESSTSDPTDPTDGGVSFCVEECRGDADCEIDGVDQGLHCEDGLCVGDFNGQCSGDQECKDLYSGWDAGDPCGAQDDCAITQGCIDLNGVGRCVYVPTEFLQCDAINMEEVPMPAIEGGTITVCGNTTAICTEDEYCINGCAGDQDCLAPAYPVCNVQTHLCECGQDSDCEAQPGTSVCDAGVCRCGEDSDCDASAYADVCVEGSCGCSELSVCGELEPVYDGTEVSCKSFG